MMGGHNGRGLPECVTLASSSSLGTDRLLQSADSPLGAIYQAATLQVPLWNTPESTAIQERPEHQWSSRKDFFLCGTGRDRGNFFFFFWTDNSTPTVTNPSSANLETQKIQGEEVKGGKKKKITCSKKQQTRGKLEKRQAFATVIVGFTFSFWRRQHQCLTMETAGRLCVPPELLWGFLIEKASVRAFWLQSCPAERSPRRTDNLTFLRPRSSDAALPCRRAAVPAPCVVSVLLKRISVWTLVSKLTQAIENTARVLSESWFGSRSAGGWNNFKNQCAEWKLGGLSG